MSRVLATNYQEVVTDQLFAGSVQLRTALQPLVGVAETTLQLDEAKRSRTIIHVDAGAGTIDDLNRLFARGYKVVAKAYLGPRIRRLASTITEWVLDPDWPERAFDWAGKEAFCYPRPIQRIVVRGRRIDATIAYVLICSLSVEQVPTTLGQQRAQAASPVTVLLTYVTLYDQRGGGTETAFKGNKGGLGLTRHNKKHFEAQQIQALLGTIAHNVVVRAHR